MLDHVVHVACQVMSSCFFVFLVWLKVGVEHLAQGPDKFLPRKVCASFCCGCSCTFVSYAAGHGKECVTECRLPFVSHSWGQNSSPRYRCMHSSLLSCFCHFPAQLKVGVECLTQGPEKFLSRKVCAFLVWLQVCMFCCFTCSRAEKGVGQMVRVKSTDSPLSAMAVVKAPPRGTGVCKITL